MAYASVLFVQLDLVLTFDTNYFTVPPKRRKTVPRAERAERFFALVEFTFNQQELFKPKAIHDI
jgi:hypothetical protein